MDAIHTLVTPSPQIAAVFVRRGELAAFPTETVYGLGADALNPDAVGRIFEAKGRPSDNPLIVHLPAFDDASQVARQIPVVAHALAEAFLPGPLTLLMPRHALLPSALTAGLPTVGVRVPGHERARAFLRACGTPVAAPSANRSGRPSPTTWHAVRDDLDGRIACILADDGLTKAGLESTVVDCTTEVPTVLRAGAVALEELRAVVPEVALGPHFGEEEPPSDAPLSSPGLRHRHYAPEARVVLVDGQEGLEPDEDAAYLGLSDPDGHPFRLFCLYDDVAAYARHLFFAFREADALGCRTIYCERVPTEGVGLALMDRLRRAADATQ